MRPLRLTASLVLYRPELATVERTLLALESSGRHVKAERPVQLRLILVDNSDSDEEFPRIAEWCEAVRPRMANWELALRRAPGNIGYGSGNNLAIEEASSDYHLVVNPDLFVCDDTLSLAIRYMEDNRDVGLLTPAVFGEDGERQYLCKRNPTLFIMFLRSFAPGWLQKIFSPILNAFEMRDCDYECEMHPIEYPTGCFMFFRTAPLKEIGGFDPHIFLHYEDADIGRRMLGVACVTYVPSVKVVHKWARDTHRSLRARWLTVKSGWYYWRKWGGLFGNEPMSEPHTQAPLTTAAGDEAAAGAGKIVFVTGADGFIGKALCGELSRLGFPCVGVVRKAPPPLTDDRVHYLAVPEITENTDWSEALRGVDCIVHLVARVHVMREELADPLKEYRRANVELTMNLARQAAKAGVRRFIFMSSIKANGERSPIGQPFTADDIPKPEDPYGLSKLEAEERLLALGSETAMEIVIIRPPLVYGPGVKANFLAMMDLLRKGFPLPFKNLDKRRSMVALDNLISLIVRCLWHPHAAGQRFLAGDGEDLTISQLLQRMAALLACRARIFSFPVFVLSAILVTAGGRKYGERLTSALQVDIRKNRRLLQWIPIVSVDEALRKTAKAYLLKSR